MQKHFDLWLYNHIVNYTEYRLVQFSFEILQLSENPGSRPELKTWPCSIPAMMSYERNVQPKHMQLPAIHSNDSNKYTVWIYYNVAIFQNHKSIYLILKVWYGSILQEESGGLPKEGDGNDKGC